MVDTERADHFTILRRGAHEAAEARARKREVQREKNDWPHCDQEQVIARQAAAENFDRAAHTRRARPEQILGAPEPEDAIVDHEHEREGREQLEQLGRLIDATQQHYFDQCAERRDDERRRHDPTPEPEPATDLRCERVGKIDAHHV